MKHKNKKVLNIFGGAVLLALMAFTGVAIASQPVFAACAEGSVETSFFGCVEDNGEGCGVWLAINLIITILTFGVVIAATVGLVITAIMYISARDNPGQLSKAKTRIFEIIIGLAVYAAMWSVASWLIPGGVFNGGDVCKTSAPSAGSSNPAPKHTEKSNKVKPVNSDDSDIEDDDSDDNSDNDDSDETNNDGTLSCSLQYNSTTGELTFAKASGAKKYAIAKKGKSPQYKASKVTYYPGADRYSGSNRKKDNVTMNYVGYVKNSSGKVAKCNKEVKVSRGAAAVEYGKTFLGKPYCHWYDKKRGHYRQSWWGTPDLVCTDCSGFVGGIYHYLGKEITRDDDKMCAGHGTYKVSLANAKVGDIVCRWKNNSAKWSHVMFYLGKRDGKKVKILQMGGGKGKVNYSSTKSYKKIVRVSGSN